MNVRKLLSELDEIKNSPVSTSVTVTTVGNNSDFIFQDHYYYPKGIKKISVKREGGEAVIYVYTNAHSRYPHLTIPFDGTYIHWTDENKNHIPGVENWPHEVQRFAHCVR